MNNKKINNISKSSSNKFFSVISKYMEIPTFIVYVIIFTIFSIFATNFLTLENFGNITNIVAEIGIIGIGITLLMISGEIDLSVGSVFGVTMIVFGSMLNMNLPLIIPVIIAIILGITIGFMNGILVTKTKIPSFIATLGMMFILRGIILIVSLLKPETYVFKGEQLFLQVLNGPLSFLVGTKLANFSASIIWALILLVIFQIILFKTKFGNAIFAVGGEPDVARSMGVNVERIKIINFMIVGGLTALSSCIAFSRFRFLDFFSNINVPLQAIAVVVIGGTLLRGGSGSIFGTFLGASILAMLGSGLILLGVNAYYYRTFVGLLIIIAVIISSTLTRRMERL